ncbi:MAG TPA: PAS domain-containing protein, partial [Candidatus Saccharimonadia bacterium]|nr:PAS domain-containing protein [Candidatus Saccharimonadia bacterium]
MFRILVDTVMDYGIFLLDPTGRVISWNAGAARLKGYRAHEIIGKHFSTFYTADAKATGWPAVELERAAADGRFEDEGWRVRKDGTMFWANVIITALRGPGGELSGFAKVTRDLTERREHEVALRQSEERMRLVIEGVKDYAI